MDIKFEKAPTEVFIKNIGDRSDSKRPGYFVYHDAETHEGELITVLCHGVYEPATQFVKGVIAGKTFHFPLPTYHKLKGSATPDKPAQDAKYTGGQPAPPAQQAAEKPKDYPWATEALPAGEHHKKILILDIKPAINKDGVRMTNEYQGKVAYKFNVTFALDGVKRTAIIDSSSEIDPMIPQTGEVDIIIKVTPAQREGGKPFYALKKPKSGGGGFGGGSAPADPALVLLAGIVSNPNIKIADWESALLTAISALNSAKKSLGGSK